MNTLRRKYAVALLLFSGTAICAWAIPGYHINSDASAQQAVHQYADNSFQFGAVAYQASLDKNLWRLALAAHQYLQQQPTNPERECSFAMAYWQSQQAATTENVPPHEAKKLQGLYDEAVRNTKDAVRQKPKSVEAHLTYGHYLQYYALMDKSNIPKMLREYQQAVALSPNLGYAHYALALGYMGSGDYSPQNPDRVLAQLNKALALDPRLTQSYFFMAAMYWKKKDYRQDQLYLNRYLESHPEAASRPDIIVVQKILAEKLGKG